MSLNKLSADICLKRCTFLCIAERNSLLPQCYWFFPAFFFFFLIEGSAVGHSTHSVTRTVELVNTMTVHFVILRASAYGSLLDFILLRPKFLLNLIHLGIFLSGLTLFLSLYLCLFPFLYNKPHSYRIINNLYINGMIYWTVDY